MDEIEINKAEYQEKINIEFIKIAHNEYIENFKGLKEFSTSGIRVLMLLNGGAIIAILALIGNMYGKIGVEAHNMLSKFINSMLPSFIYFGGGLFLAGIVAILAYINFSLLEATIPDCWKLLRWTKGEKLEDSKHMACSILVTARAGAILAAVSLLLFAIGSWQVYTAFQVLAGFKN